MGHPGSGADWVFAQGGNDFVDAGIGDDVVFAEGGDDTILGQSGNDVLNGDDKDTPVGEHGDDYLDGSNRFAHPDTICLTKKPCSAITIQHYLLVGILREVEDLHWRMAA